MTALRTVIGTRGYFAPEIIDLQTYGRADTKESKSYTFAVDLWCLGLVTHRILTLGLPFVTELDLVRYTTNQDEHPWAELKERKISQLGQNFIRELLAPSPQNRLTAVQASKHAWIRKEQGEQLLFTSQGER